MPCIFFTNVPPSLEMEERFGLVFYEGGLLLQSAIVEAVLCDDVEIHWPEFPSRWRLIGKINHWSCSEIHFGVYVRVEWHAGRDNGIREKVAIAIFGFLKALKMEEGMNLTFVDCPLGQSFWTEKDGRVILVK